MSKLSALLAALLGPAAALATDTPSLLLPPALGRTDLVWIAGRVLAEHQGRHGPTALRTGRTLSATNLPGAEVEVTFRGRTARTVSGHDGEFLVAITAPPGEPFPPGTAPYEVAAAGVRGAGVAHVVDPASRFLVVSDFDDTVAITNVTSTAAVLATTFLRDADTHPPVPGMAALYRCLTGAGTAPPRPLAFVSGSPIQLAPRVARFLELHRFPPAALFLRNLGPGSLSGYKEPVLRTLLARFPHPLVLVGDSGERDPEIYADLAREFPDRVLRIYVRQATRDPGPPARFEGMLLFRDPAEAARDAAARGLAAAACVEEAFPSAPAR